MTRTITIQPGQSGEGMAYDVRKPLPYPFHIDSATGDCVRGRGTVDLHEAMQGRPWRLVGFQATHEHVLAVTFEQFRAGPELIVGMYPVFTVAVAGRRSSIFNLDVPITGVTVTVHQSVGA